MHDLLVKSKTRRTNKMIGLLKISLYLLALCLHDSVVFSVEDIIFHDSPYINSTYSEIVVSSRRNLTLTCSGKKPLTWIYPENEESESEEQSTKLVSITEIPESEYPYGLMLEIIGILPADVGYYTCLYNTTDDISAQVEDLERQGKAKRVYVFVDDPETLMVPAHMVINGKQYDNITFPCRPTAPNVDVDLYLKEGDTSLKVNDRASYDPHVGFTVLVTNVVENSYTCVATRGSTQYETEIFLHLHTYTSSVPKPQITDAYNGNAVIGGEISLQCDVRLERGIQFDLTWILPNNDLDRTGRLLKTETTVGDYIGKNNVNQKTGTSRLTILKATKEDEGIYRCEVIDVNKNQNRDEKRIIIRDVGESYINLTEPAGAYRLVLDAGKFAKWFIQVNAFPPPNITWFDNHNNKIVDPWMEPHVAKMEVKTSYNAKQVGIFIQDLRLSDAGTYRVQATNQFETKELNLTLLVKAPPKVFLDSQKYYLANTNASIHCKVEMFPLGKVFWYFKDCLEESECVSAQRVEIPNNMYKTNGSGYTMDSYLTMYANKSGYVICHAKSNLGQDSYAQPFYVSEVDGGFGISGREGIIAAGDNVTLTCVSSIYEDNGPLNWYRENDGTILDEDSNNDVFVIHEKSQYSYKLYLRIPNALKSHNGAYTCKAGNGGINEEHSKQIYLDVKDTVKPEIVRTNLNDTDLHLRLGVPNINFDCFANGIPVPIIRWFKDNVELEPESPDSRLSILNIGNRGRQLRFKYITEEDYGEYRCMAFNKVGSTTRFVNIVITNREFKIVYIAPIAILAVIFLVLIFYLIWRIKKEKQIRKELSLAGLLHFEEGDTQCLNPELGIDEQADLLPYDKKWEFPREKLILGPQLGSGAFGVVMKAKAHNIVEAEEKTTVAVKMVKKTADATFIKALASELKIMVHLGKHLNVVNLLGACTNNVSKRELLVIVEYCRFGNIHNYLLRHRDNFINQIARNTDTIDLTIGAGQINRACSVSSTRSGTDREENLESSLGSGGLHSPNLDTNNTVISMVAGTGDPDGVTSNGSAQPEWRSNYRGDYNYNKDIKPITTQDLICWAFQVARGMEYLANRKVLHGDLAARNILLADNNIVKICDFGLAKSMYKNDNYKKKGDGPLPVKWMAIESIRDRVFSTQSDVWSYGIVLWEMFSLAKTPYPGMDADEKFYNRLVKGYRMEKPEYANKLLYHTMLECWRAQPIQRPSFGQLSDRLGSMLEDGVRNHYIDLNSPYMDMNSKWMAERGDNDYLAMMSAPDYGNLVSSNNHQYVNDPFGGPTSVNPLSPDDTDPEGYLRMIPAKNGMVVRNTPIFNFDAPLTGKTDDKETELIPMLDVHRLTSHSDTSDVDPTSPRTPQSPNTINIINSFSNPSYEPMFKLTRPIEEESMEDIASDNYVKMSQKDSGFIDSSDIDPSNYVTMTGNKSNSAPLYNNFSPTTVI